ncbi:SAM-dependent methyltransferase, partial [Salmonella enterica]|uniref:SAM-dependent methyltransferase n=1 Tax=Salmonella enterica TaxID=28901 RepID=UPI003CF2D3EA
HLLRGNNKAGSKRNIHAHYDLGNAFYSRWLDPTMTYSAARFEKPGEPLSEAQRRKYRTLAESMDLKAGQHVLEIGCGWGGF